MTTTGNARPASDSATRGGRVVVGVDGSPRSLDALDFAAEVADWQHWSLDIVTTWEPPTAASVVAFDYGDVIVAQCEAAESTARSAQAHVRERYPRLEVVTMTEQGSASRVLTEESKGADLLVLGSRGLGGFSSLALGSVGQSCVHHAHCPVLIVRPKTKEVVT